MNGELKIFTGIWQKRSIGFSVMYTIIQLGSLAL